MELIFSLEHTCDDTNKEIIKNKHKLDLTIFSPSDKNTNIS